MWHRILPRLKVKGISRVCSYAIYLGSCAAFNPIEVTFNQSPNYSSQDQDAPNPQGALPKTLQGALPKTLQGALPQTPMGDCPKPLRCPKPRPMGYCPKPCKGHCPKPCKPLYLNEESGNPLPSWASWSVRAEIFFSLSASIVRCFSSPPWTCSTWNKNTSPGGNFQVL